VTPEEKQLELQRHREILIATIDYLKVLHGESFVLDDEKHIEEYYEAQKTRVEKYYNQRRLDKLQQKLTSLVETLHDDLDQKFSAYIKERTGYNMDLFGDLKKRVEIILSKSQIDNDKEGRDIGTILHQLIETSSSPDEIARLQSLLLQYHHKNKKKKYGHSEVVSIEEKDGIIIETIDFTTGPKPKHNTEQWVPSPDGKRKLRIAQWSDGKQASTYVAIHFANGASGAVYGLNGICPDVKAWWKDNSTIIIETRKEYNANQQHKQVRSYDDVIAIEYVEY